MPSDPGASYGLLETLHRRERKMLKSFFLRRAPDLQSESDDLVQEVFLRILKRGNGREIEQPERYIFRTAANVLADLRRRRVVRKAESHVELDKAREPADSLYCPERALISKQEIESVATALNELDEKVRVAFVLHRLEDLTYREIATRMSVSVSSVEKYIMRALVHLADRTGRER